MAMVWPYSTHLPRRALHGSASLLLFISRLCVQPLLMLIILSVHPHLVRLERRTTSLPRNVKIVLTQPFLLMVDTNA